MAVKRPLLLEKPVEGVPLVLHVYKLVHDLVLPVHLVLLLLLPLSKPGSVIHHDVLEPLNLPVQGIAVPGVHHVVIQLLLNPSSGHKTFIICHHILHFQKNPAPHTFELLKSHF